MFAVQTLLFGGDRPAVDTTFTHASRTELGGGAWVDTVPAWMSGQATLFSALLRETRWRQHARPMYDRIVDVPRLTAALPDDGPGHPSLVDAAAALSLRYHLPLHRVSLAWYRDGQDSVAWHGDRLTHHPHDTVVAVLSLGGPRKFLMKPTTGGPSRSWLVGLGDLVVMGGSCQTTWLHCVPKSPGAPPRIAVMFRSEA